MDQLRNMSPDMMFVSVGPYVVNKKTHVFRQKINIGYDLKEFKLYVM